MKKVMNAEMNMNADVFQRQQLTEVERNTNLEETGCSFVEHTEVIKCLAMVSRQS